MAHRILLAAGSNAKGQLGIGSHDDAHTFSPCQFADRDDRPPDGATVTQIACGANHTVLLLTHLDGSTTLWGAGDGGRGQLGPGYPGVESEPWTVFRQLRVAPREQGYACTRIAAAWETTYVVLSCPGRSDVLLSMGSHDFGALGVGEVGGPAGPRVVAFDHVFSPARAGDAGLWQALCVRSLHAGPRHVVAQLEVSSTDADESASRTVLVGWGASRHGQLGQHGARVVARPTLLPIDIQADPMVSCALGNQHTVVLHASGHLSALGSNKQGQIPGPSLGDARARRLGCTWNGTYVETVEGGRCVLRASGSNAQGQLGRGGAASTSDMIVCLPEDRAISNLVCGSEHVLVAMSGSSQGRDSVLGWGWNEHGNMGLASLSNITIPTQLWPRQDIEVYGKYPQRVIGIWAGCATSWLLVE